MNMRKGQIILGLSTSGQLILDPTSQHQPSEEVMVFHEHCCNLVEPKHFRYDWEDDAPMTAQDLADLDLLLQRQIFLLSQTDDNGNPMTDEPVGTMLPVPKDGILGMYLGVWIHNPDNSFKPEDRIIKVLIGDTVYWMPVLSERTPSAPRT